MKIIELAEGIRVIEPKKLPGMLSFGRFVKHYKKNSTPKRLLYKYGKAYFLYKNRFGTEKRSLDEESESESENKRQRVEGEGVGAGNRTSEEQESNHETINLNPNDRRIVMRGKSEYQQRMKKYINAVRDTPEYRNIKKTKAPQFQIDILASSLKNIDELIRQTIDKEYDLRQLKKLFTKTELDSFLDKQPSKIHKAILVHKLMKKLFNQNAPDGIESGILELARDRRDIRELLQRYHILPLSTEDEDFDYKWRNVIDENEFEPTSSNIDLSKEPHIPFDYKEYSKESKANAEAIENKHQELLASNENYRNITELIPPLQNTAEELQRVEVQCKDLPLNAPCPPGCRCPRAMLAEDKELFKTNIRKRRIFHWDSLQNNPTDVPQDYLCDHAENEECNEGCIRYKRRIRQPITSEYKPLCETCNTLLLPCPENIHQPGEPCTAECLLRKQRIREMCTSDCDTIAHGPMVTSTRDVPNERNEDVYTHYERMKMENGIPFTEAEQKRIDKRIAARNIRK